MWRVVTHATLISLFRKPLDDTEEEEPKHIAAKGMDMRYHEADNSQYELGCLSQDAKGGVLIVFSLITIRHEHTCNAH